MKIKLLLIFTLLLSMALGARADDVWTERTATNSSPILGITHSSGNTLYAISSGTLQSGKLWKTTNNGQSWTNSFSNSLGFISLAWNSSTSELYFSGASQLNGGKLWKTANGTDTDQVLTASEMGRGFGAVSLTGGNIYLCDYYYNNHNLVIKSTNNGTDWINDAFPDLGADGAPMTMLVDPSNENIYVGTSDDGLLKYNGTSWGVSYDTENQVYFVQFLGSSIVAGIADGGLIISTNNGTSWEHLSDDVLSTTESVISFISLQFEGTNYYFVGADDGKIYRSDDGGDSWEEFISGINSSDTQISTFSFNNDILIAGSDKRFYTCDDPGAEISYEPPAAPENLVADAGNAFVDLSWDPVEGDGINYRLYRREADGEYTNLTTSYIYNNTSTSYTDEGVTNGTQYYYIVRAYDTQHDLYSTYYSEVGARPDQPRYATPTNLHITQVGDGSLSLAWTASGNQDGNMQYKVLRQEGSGGGWTGNETVAGTTSGTTLVDNDVSNDTEYFYVVFAEATGGNMANSYYSNETYGTPVEDQPDPPNPASSLGVEIGDGELTLYWDASTTPDVTYRVYGGPSSSTVTTLIAGGFAQTYYTDYNVTNETEYQYYVVAVAANVESTPTSTVTGTPTEVPPPAPINLAAYPGNTEAYLTWNRGENGPNVTYRVFARPSTTDNWGPPVSDYEEIGTNTSATVTGLTNETLYYFRVQAWDDSKQTEHESDYSAIAQTTPITPRPAAPTNLEVTASGHEFISIQWTPSVSSGVTQGIYRKTPDSEYTMRSQIDDNTTSSFTDNNLQNGTRYYYVVRSDNGVKESYDSGEVSAIPMASNPEPPANLTAESGNASGQIDLSWDLSPSPNVTEYRIYRSTNKDDMGDTPYDTQEDETVGEYLDQNATNGQRYYYVVSAYDADNGGGLESPTTTNQVTVVPYNKREVNLSVTPPGRIELDRFFEGTYTVNAVDYKGDPLPGPITYTNPITNETDVELQLNNGSATYTFEVPSDAEFKDYTLNFVYADDNDEYEDVTVNRDVTLMGLPRKKELYNYFYYTVDGEEVTEYLVFDCGEGNNYDSPGPDLLKNIVDVKVNNFVIFNGDMLLDTANYTFTFTGRIYVEGVNLPGGGTGEFTLHNSSKELLGSYASGNFVLTSGEFENVTPVAGLSFTYDELIVIGRLLANAVTFDGVTQMKPVRAGCLEDGEDDLKNFDLVFDNMVLPKFDSLYFDNSEQGNMSLLPGGCMKDIMVPHYYLWKDEITLDGNFEISWMSCGITAPINNGEFDDAMLYLGIGQDTVRVEGTGMSFPEFSGKISDINEPPAKINLDATLRSADPTWFELDMLGSLHMPSQITYNQSKVRMMKTGDVWQVRGFVSGDMHVKTYVKMNGNFSAGKVNDYSYVVEGSASLMYKWRPRQYLRGTVDGYMYMPKLADEYPYDLVNIMLGLPRTVDKCVIVFRDTEIMGNVDLGKILGKFNFTLDLKKQWGDDGFLEFGQGTMNLNNTIRKGQPKSSQMANFDPYKTEGQSLPLLRGGSKPKTQLAGGGSDTVGVTNKMGKVFIRISSEEQVPGSFLVRPGNEKVTGTDNTDSTIVYVESNDKKKAYWVITPSGDNAENDQSWQIHAPKAKATDSLDVFATPKDPDIAYTLTFDYPTLEVSWGTDELYYVKDLDFYLTESSSTTSSNGIHIGSASINSGYFTYDVDDSLKACLYYLYVEEMSTDSSSGNAITRKYFDTLIVNDKPSLPAPAPLHAVYYETTNILRVNWTEPSVSNAEGYKLVYYDFETSIDSVVSTAWVGDTYLEKEMDNLPAIDSLMIFTFDSDGNEGCDYTVTEIIHDTEEVYEGQLGQLNDDKRLVMFPNPFANKAYMRYTSSGFAEVKLEVLDMFGRSIAVIDQGMRKEGTYDVSWEPSGELASGTYIVRFSDGENVITKILVLRR